MNLFYLDTDIDKCAEAHIDKHVTKMQLEIGQMLCTNLWIDEVVGYVPRKIESVEFSDVRAAAQEANLPTSVRYKPCFQNHPCTIWMRQSYDNWEYSWLLLLALDAEAQWRGYKPHKSAEMAINLDFPTNMESLGFTTPAQAMFDEFKNDDVIKAYRDYYQGPKAAFSTYTRREPPSWFEANWQQTNNKWEIK